MEHLTKVQIALTLSVLSYVKPGSLHRFNASDSVDYASLTGSIIAPEVLEAVERGSAVRLGERSVDRLGLGELVFKACRRFFELTSRKPPFGAILTHVVLSAAVGMGDPRRLRGFSVRSEVRLVAASLTETDLRNVYKCFELFGGAEELSRIAEGAPSAAYAEPGAVIERLASEFPDYVLTDKRLDEAYDVARVIKRAYERSRSMNYSVVAGYLYYMQTRGARGFAALKGKLKECEDLGLTGSSKGLRCLLEVDKDVRRGGASFEREAYFMSVPVLVCLYEGIRL